VKQDGSKQSSIDVLLVMEGYGTDSEAREHADFYSGVSGTDRGLLDVFPMNVSEGRFNIWYVEARDGSNAIGGSNGPFREARYQMGQCSADYAFYLSKNTQEWGTAAKDEVARVKGIESKIAKENGAIGLIHEWGHIFGGLADEYDFNEGLREPTRPNCAANRSQAQKWWGPMADTSSSVGYENGCKNSEDMIEPHIGQTIMGDGGLWGYGPVNDRQMLETIASETEPITDIALEEASLVDNEIEVSLTYSKASNVVEIELVQTGEQTTTFVHGSGTETLTFQAPEANEEIELRAETIENTIETKSANNYATVQTSTEQSQTQQSPSEELRSRVQQTQQELEKSEDRLDNLTSEVARLNSRIDELEAQKRRLESEKQRLRSQISDMEHRNTTLNSAVRDLRSRNEELRQRIRRLNSSSSRNRGLEALSAENEALRTQNREYKEALRQLRQQRSRTSTENTSRTGEKAGSPSKPAVRNRFEQPGLIQILRNLF
jgi:predicted  nucleic acid-binding Zn-ribbon protein